MQGTGHITDDRPSSCTQTMTDQHPPTAEPRRSLHPYVSDQALEVLAAQPDGGWNEIDGTLAFFDISGFTKLTERLAAWVAAGPSTSTTSSTPCSPD